jgi:hypothetical protein
MNAHNQQRISGNIDDDDDDEGQSGSVTANYDQRLIRQM